MMQKIRSVLFTIAVISIGVSVMGFITLNFLLKPSPTTESPELVQAKTLAQLAELARQQASNAWWGGFWQVVAILLLTLVLGGFSLALAIKWRGFTHRIRVEEAQLKLSTMIIPPDQNGNFPLTRVNGEFIRYKSGNPGISMPQQPIGLLEAPRTRTDRQIRIQGNDYSVHGKVPDSQPPTPSRAPSRSTFEAGADAQSRSSEMRIVENLRTAKEGRRGKGKSIQRFCNAVEGESADYEKWSIVWDNL